MEINAEIGEENAELFGKGAELKSGNGEPPEECCKNGD